jgi:flagellar FliL protein
MADAPSAQEQKKPKSKLGLMLVLLLLIIGAGGGGYFWFFVLHGSAQAASHHKKNSDEIEAVLHLDPFLFNLSGNEGTSFLRLGVDVGLDRKLPQTPEKIAQLTPLVRDTFIGVVSSSTADDLLAAGGQAKLKATLLKELQERVPELGASAIYFTDFLVQR